jgi:hypothetical protein
MTLPLFAVSSWSLHRSLGFTFPDNPAQQGTGQREDTYGPGTLSFPALPTRLAEHELSRLEICHFHLNGKDHGARRGGGAA